MRKPCDGGSHRRGEAGGFSAIARLENHRNVAAAVVCVRFSSNVIISVIMFMFLFKCRVENSLKWLCVLFFVV